VEVGSLVVVATVEHRLAPSANATSVLAAASFASAKHVYVGSDAPTTLEAEATDPDAPADGNDRSDASGLQCAVGCQIVAVVAAGAVVAAIVAVLVAFVINPRSKDARRRPAKPEPEGTLNASDMSAASCDTPDSPSVGSPANPLSSPDEACHGDSVAVEDPPVPALSVTAPSGYEPDGAVRDSATPSERPRRRSLRPLRRADPAANPTTTADAPTPTLSPLVPVSGAEVRRRRRRWERTQRLALANSDSEWTSELSEGSSNGSGRRVRINTDANVVVDVPPRAPVRRRIRVDDEGDGEHGGAAPQQQQLQILTLPPALSPLDAAGQQVALADEANPWVF